MTWYNENEEACTQEPSRSQRDDVNQNPGFGIDNYITP